MGNLCNIKCRICSPWHSTPWVAEQAKIDNPDTPKKYTHHVRWNSFKESFSYENDYFWKDIVKLLPMAERFDFAGGEPFYIDKHWDIVKMCVENGWSKNQHIHYNTNGTIYPEKYIDLLDQFKIIDIQVSSDGVKEKFEYLRHPAKWDVAESTIDRLCAAKESAKSQWIIGVCLSISAFNVFDFFEMFEHYAAKDVSIYINVVHDHRGIRILPPELKKLIVERLNLCQSMHKTIQWERERNMICRHLENTEYNAHDWREFWKEINLRDDLRNESFKETFPEYYSVMKEFLI
jgi:MoaA/NifB/PqqE/SkfB family radical SAM enzyme